jgi:BON domain
MLQARSVPAFDVATHKLSKVPLDRARAARGIVDSSYMRSITMKLFNRFAPFCCALLLASLVGCASTPKQEGTGEYVDDTVITTKVKAAVFSEPSLKSAEINVETFKGVVQLSGFVSSRADINKAVEVAGSVQGVKSVKNDMRLKGQP